MKRLTIRNSDGSVSQPMGLNWQQALERLAYYEDVAMWISVKDRLPEIKEHHCSDEVLIYTECGIMGIDHLEENVFGGCVFSCERPTPYEDSEIEVTHWMPLPEPPTDGKKMRD